MSFFRSLVLLALPLSLGACRLYFSDLEIFNGGRDRIENITISDGHSTWRLGKLDPGEHVRFSGHLVGEGGPRIAWVWQGREFATVGCYYTGGSQAAGKIAIVAASVRYQCQ